MSVILSYKEDPRYIEAKKNKEDKSFVCHCVPVHLIADLTKRKHGSHQVFDRIIRTS